LLFVDKFTLTSKSGDAIALTYSQSLETSTVVQTNLLRATTFQLIPCLNMASVDASHQQLCISIVPVDYPTSHVIHRSFLLYAETYDYYPYVKYLYPIDASFIVRKDKFYPNYVAFESIWSNYAGYFVSCQVLGAQLHIVQPGTATGQDLASFTVTAIAP